MRSVRRIQGDGNCLFRAFSYILTGSADQHIGVRHAIIDHMTNNAQYFRGHHLVGYGSIQSYIAFTGMDQDGTWGTDIEMLSLAHLFQTPVFSYSQQHGQWQRYSPHDVDRQLMDDIHQSFLPLQLFKGCDLLSKGHWSLNHS
ncbi:OVARIAN TUMOR DOMAIN-containing deubiquitinating enzyme 9 [Geodia barretti]|uniref:OVARIAN TUMOR DOMAIN-containing deubiquitinating enzyme 9 n=1 Tax=Geodia barretti TaxID=519541 RepID=A0AA35ST50_GEOBA|nr:OVARIAN TUMOR DOMAIN-containing deubiquitinating enzyme 9 [Geodia barretti]